MSKSKALLDYTEAFSNPKKVWESHDELSKFLGNINELLYGVNTYKPQIQNPNDVSDEKNNEEREDLVAENLEEEAIIEGKVAGLEKDI